MKIRSGFVSNSSTSSFILVGFQVNEDELPEDFDAWDFADNLDKKYRDARYVSDYMGVSLAYWSDEDYLETQGLDLVELNEKVELAKGLMKELNLKDRKVELIFGTTSS